MILYGILDIVTYVQVIAAGTNNNILLVIRKLSFNIGIISFGLTVLLGVVYYILDKKMM